MASPKPFTKVTSEGSPIARIMYQRPVLVLIILSLTFTPEPRISATIPPSQWDADHGARATRAAEHGRSPPDEIFVRWLHIPKTATSFANTLIRWGCPEQRAFVTPRKERPNMRYPVKSTHFWDWLFLNSTGRTWLRSNCAPRLVRSYNGRVEYAFCMHRALDRWHVKHAVALFRLPLQRIYSNYLHLSRHYNESQPPRQCLSSFVKRSEFSSQQAKLLLGRHYRDPRIVTREDAYQAASIVDNMLFVGLTEHFRLSCRLFHAMFGGVPHRLQFENIRPSILRFRDAGMKREDFRYDEAAFRGWRDTADDIVYRAACNRFWTDVTRFKIEIEKDGLGLVLIPADAFV